jgi:hypothetical protein
MNTHTEIKLIHKLEEFFFGKLGLVDYAQQSPGFDFSTARNGD